MRWQLDALRSLGAACVAVAVARFCWVLHVPRLALTDAVFSGNMLKHRQLPVT
jgi:hypothetical protein